VDPVHVFVDRPGTLGPPWNDAGADSGHGGVLTRARPPAALVRRSSPAGVEQREEHTRISIRASPGLERCRGGWVMTVQSGETTALGERVAQAGKEGNVTRRVLAFYRGRGSSGKG
jgi:hypothetical protein